LPNYVSTSREREVAKPSADGTLVRVGAVGIVVLAVVGIFLYLGGWFSPHKLTPARFTDAFQEINGTHSGFRRNHGKGVDVTGYFESNGQGARLSKAVVFTVGRVPVIGRFSVGSGQPYVADAPDTARGLGLLFRLPDGEGWRMAMVNLPVFVVTGPQGFYDLMMASRPDPATGKPDPAKMAAFFGSHPETVQAFTVIKSHPVSSGFDNSTFNSLNAFRFIDNNGNSTPVRWSLVPPQPFAPVAAAGADQADKNYLFDALIASMHQHPLQWRLLVTVGQPGDPTDNATIPWPEGREQVDVGTLTLDHIESDDTGVAREINFDPLILPAGISPSDDPLLSARSAVYSQSFTRRAGETKEPSAVTPSEVQK